MRGKLLQPVFLCFALLAVIGASACGTVATPEWAAEAQATRVALASTDEYLTSIAPTPTYTFTPSATPTTIPTATPPPATATPSPAPTEAPTAAPTNTTAPAAPPAAAEGGDDPIAVALAAGDPTAGQAIFNQQINMPDGAVWMCSQCHSITPDQLRLIGPGLWGLADRAGTRVEGQGPVDYIHTSIVHPNDFIVPPDAAGPYPPNLMPQHYGELLTEDQLTDLIAYLVTLR